MKLQTYNSCLTYNISYTLEEYNKMHI